VQLGHFLFDEAPHEEEELASDEDDRLAAVPSLEERDLVIPGRRIGADQIGGAFESLRSVPSGPRGRSRGRSRFRPRSAGGSFAGDRPDPRSARSGRASASPVEVPSSVRPALSYPEEVRARRSPRDPSGAPGILRSPEFRGSSGPFSGDGGPGSGFRGRCSRSARIRAAPSSSASIPSSFDRLTR